MEAEGTGAEHSCPQGGPREGGWDKEGTVNSPGFLGIFPIRRFLMPIRVLSFSFNPVVDVLSRLQMLAQSREGLPSIVREIRVGGLI